MGSYKTQGNRLIFTSGGEKTVLEPWGANSLRVRAVMMGEMLETDYALLPPVETAAVIECSENGAAIANGGIIAKVETEEWTGRGRICFYNRRGEVLLREISPQGCLKLRARDYQPAAGGDHRLTVSFEPSEGEKLYGMGQYQQEILDVKNCSFELAQRNSQASVPFVLSNKGYGFLWHNPAIGRAFFGRNKTEWTAGSTKQMDYWITAGDTPAEILEAYAEATGRPPMMPEYGLGFWQCKLRYWNREQLLGVAREYKRRGLRVDVIVADFFHWPYSGDYRFDEEFFPDPEGMAGELESLGMKLMVSVWPLVDERSENYKKMTDENLLIKTEKGLNIAMDFQGNGLFVDATNPDAREFLWQACKKNYYDKGIGLFWLDVAEPEYSAYDFDHYRYHMGTNAQIGNIYPQLYSRAFYDGLRREGKNEVVSLLRCAWAGSQRYGSLVWSGDIHSTYEDFRKQVCAGLQMGLSGIPWWTTDIGGFYGGDPDDERFRKLLVRWFQYGTFCPVMRLHGNRAVRRPEDGEVRRKDGTLMLSSGGDNEVWSFGEEVYSILVRYMALRERLRPITRGLMREAHEKGTPVMRAMFYEFPGDAPCWDIKDQYMFGGDILVAPVVWEDAYEREVYLPAGAEWTDMRDGETYGGGRSVTVNAPLETMPVFFKDGAHRELIGAI